RLDRGNCRIAVVGRTGGMAFILQQSRDQFADVGFVVDDKDVGCHGYCAAFCNACSATSGPVSVVNRNLTQAPRSPGYFSATSCNSMRPPCSSRIRPTIAKPRPVPFSRVVT